MAMELPLSTERAYDADGAVIHMGHILEAARPPMAGYPQTVIGTAEAYLEGVADVYGITPDMLGDVAASPASEPIEEGVRLKRAYLRHDSGTATILYAQTVLGLPIWEAGVAVNLAENPLRVTSSRSTLHAGVHITAPSPASLATIITTERLRTLLGLGSGDPLPTINGEEVRVYRFDLGNRIHRDASSPDFPDATLPDVPVSIVPDGHYVVREILFSMDWGTHGVVPARCFVEPETECVVYLDVFITGVTGKVFVRDPFRQGAPADRDAAASEVLLDPYASEVDLLGLVPAVGGVQHLDGRNDYVKIVDIGPPSGGDNIQPTEVVSVPFNYGARSPKFAAVNAYYHYDGLFRRAARLLIPTDFASLFDGTNFPVSVDHFYYINPNNNKIEAGAFTVPTPDGKGVAEFRCSWAEDATTVSTALDWAVACHEFSHALLFDATFAANFGFAHSCGDAIAAILNDPESVYYSGLEDPNRFVTFPWEKASDPTLTLRNHGRPLKLGNDTRYNFAWGGARDKGNADYGAEQILSTTLFRAYRSLGGDSPDISRKTFAADMMLMLICQTIRALGDATVTPTLKATVFANKMMAVDKTLLPTVWGGGHVMGAYHKVIRWAFEKQGAYHPDTEPKPIKTPGPPPEYDIYIGDGRSGEYQYQPVWWENPNIWNRTSQDGQPGHQNPKLNQTNYLYVRIKNRGSQDVSGAVVKAFKCRPGVGLTWPFDWTRIGPANGMVAATVLANHGNEVIVGPFPWTPTSANHECLLAYVHHQHDPANAEINQLDPPPCAAGPIPEWRLVPNDNNIGQRNMQPVPGAPGSAGICDFLSGRNWWVKNPSMRTITVHLLPTMPAFMTERGWGLGFTNPGGNTFTLAPGAEMMVGMACIAGTPFTAAEIPADDRLIRVTAYAEGPNEEGHVGGEMGGMTYEIYPGLG